jgi:hypothetical protein
MMANATNSLTVTYSREPHAAHYAYDHPKRGHDLERWSYAQERRLPVPVGVPRNAEYHSGFMRDGMQHWTYVRTAPLTGSCAFCDRLARRAS